MKTSNFSRMPSVSISRSKFLRKSQCKTSCVLGDLIPIYLDEVLPGDTRSIDIASLVRMSTPVAPIMDNVYADIYAFFVPNRIVWDHWKEFMGENNSSAGIYSGTAYKIPQVNILSYGNVSGKIGDYYGLPCLPYHATNTLKVSALPVRGYRRIYNRFFRDQNVIAPVTVNTADNVNGNDSYYVSPFKVAKISDYFTRSLPYAQKGSPVTIPMAGNAPIVGSLLFHDVPNGIKFADAAGNALPDDKIVFTKNGGLVAADNDQSVGILSATSKVIGVKTNMIADLSNVTAATINQLRFAFQYQKLLEKDALYGTRYWEIIKAHFGVVAPDASLQDPELLGHRKIYINVDQVVQTTGINQSTPGSNTLGATAAVSVTGDAGNLFTKSFTEHGYIHILICFRHDQTYAQGLERHWSRSERNDFYFPVFANLGAQVVKNKELYATGTSVDDAPFGYQEAWAEYRYKPSKATGLLNPSVTGSLGYWTLTSNFGSQPTLGQTFIEQDRNSIARVLQTGATGPDFICDFAFKDIAVRPMPLYSVPGLIDHH